MKNTMRQAPLQIYWGLAFFFLLAFTAWLYFPGLQSGFILDDEVNLAGLKTISQLFSHDALRFILEGESSNLGRPISLVSFAWQAYQWPDPVPFKYINLLLHLLNACLIFWILLKLGEVMQLPKQNILWTAFLSTAIWMLHPFQVSTTLYVIQRMAQLGVFFTLLGILGYLIGRTELEVHRIRSGLVWMSLGIGIGLLGVLAKETAVLLIFYVLVLEFTLLAHLKKTKLWYLWASLFLFFPIFLLVSYFTVTWSGVLGGYQRRDFTLEQRLMTEARVLWDYVHKILLPAPNSFSIFHDDWTISKHILQPITTLSSILALFLFTTLALWKRKQWSVFAFAVLWFLVGHSLEGSIIALKLYFEHRNYLPLLGPVFALVYFFTIVLNSLNIKYQIKKLLFTLSVFWLFALVFITWLEIELWRRPLTQAALWAELKPQSRYAQSHYASKLGEIGQYDKAIEVYQQMGQKLQNDVSPYLFWLAINCYKPELSAPNIQKLKTHLKATIGDEGFDAALKSLRTLWEENTCPKLITTQFLEQDIFQPLLSNSNLAKSYQQILYYNYAHFQAAQKNYQQALNYVDIATANTINLKITRLNWMIGSGKLNEAQIYAEQTLSTLKFKDHFLHAHYFNFLSAKLSQLNTQNEKYHK